MNVNVIETDVHQHKCKPSESIDVSDIDIEYFDIATLKMKLSKWSTNKNEQRTKHESLQHELSERIYTQKFNYIDISTSINLKDINNSHYISWCELNRIVWW